MGKKCAPMDERQGRTRNAILLIGLVLIAAVIRARGLTGANLWLDEANSWQVASAPWHNLFTDVLRSPLGPLYFVLLKLWIGAFGHSVAALRSFSLLASIALIPAVYALGVRLLSRRAAWLACWLLVLSPLELYFAQEARMYMLVSLLGAACVLAYAAWRDAVLDPSAARPARARWMLACYAAAGCALLFTHLVAGTLLVAINADAAATLWTRRRSGSTLLAWTGANVVIALVVLGYLGSVSAGSAISSQAWRSPMGIEQAVRSALLLPFDAIHGQYFYPTDFWASLNGVLAGGGVNRLFFELLLVQPLVLIALVAAFTRGRRAAAPPGGRRLLVLAVALPMLAVTVISVRRGLEFPRYLLFVIPFMFLLLADGLVALRPRARVASLVVLAAAMLLGIGTVRGVVSRDSDYRATAALLLRESRPGDRALIQPREMNAPLRYYLDSAGPPVIGVAADGSLDSAAHALAPHRTWVIIDYRSPLYALPPDELEVALDATVQRDLYASDARAGVRVALLSVQ
jgi:mannosyltransferase